MDEIHSGLRQNLTFCNTLGHLKMKIIHNSFSLTLYDMLFLIL